MRRNRIIGIVFLTLVALAIPSQSGAQHTRYRLVDLGTLGGPASYSRFGSNIINERGTTVVGWADTAIHDTAYCFNADCFISHAFRWLERTGDLKDLGALPGDVNSAVTWISANGLVAGLSENGEMDPLYPGLPEVRAVLWQESGISDLGTLPEGGYESYASAVNSRGQVVGAALNTIPDTHSMQQGTFWLWLGITPPYQYQTRAFLWDREKGMQDLGTLRGGTDAQAILINESGQVVGYSYTSSLPSPACTAAAGFALATGSFIWDQKHGMKGLGSLGGTCTLASYLNNRGQVVGTSSLARDRGFHPFLWQQGRKIKDLGTLGGDTAYPDFISDTGDVVGKADLPGPSPQNHHAVLWSRGLKIDLGTLPGDSCSRAYWVNSSGQIVGNSESDNSCSVSDSDEHAFLWEHGGPMLDLDDLIPADSSLKLARALAISDRGEIVGVGVPPGCPRGKDLVCGHAYVLIPCGEVESGGCGEQVAESQATSMQFRPEPGRRGSE